ncbi:MAG TPA: hypothetical protein VK859_03490, partial [bacterium]|nr:hypothetical protein [bacterium]
SQTVALVAGEGVAGFRDGSFTSALFNKPLGLAVSTDGTRLFVADSGNNRIRVVHLDQDNQVTTLTGQDKPGMKNGPLASAQFDLPQAIAYLPGDKLVVFDSGNKLLRLVDLGQGTVSTLAGNSHAALTEGPATLISMAGMANMAYLSAADSLFFSQPEQGALKRLDMKTGMVSSVPVTQAGISNPDALCAGEGKLYVADLHLTHIFELDWQNGALSAPRAIGDTLSNVLALGQTGDLLEAIQYLIKAPLQRLLPQNAPVAFVSPAGDQIPDPGSWLTTFNGLGTILPIGFVGDPLDSRRLFITNPALNVITSIRDLFGVGDAGGDWRNSNGLNDLEYPARKPPKTFRILLVGDSRSVMMVNYQFQTNYHHRTHDPAYPRQISLAKEMELDLNTEAALDDAPMNFEVLNLSHSGTEPLFLWPTYEVPNIVKKNDIDLVLIFEAPTPEGVLPYKFYYLNPITPEGIPRYPNDMEYLLKPPEKRIQKGVARQFYDLCKDRYLVKIDKNNFVFDEKLYLRPELHSPLVEMYGMPLDVLNKKLSTMMTSSSQPVRLLLCSLHTGVFRPLLEDPTLWGDAAKRFNIPLLDLNDDMTALRLSLFPLNEMGGNDHLNPDGHSFVGRLLAHTLIKDGLIPWNGNSKIP